MRKRKVHILRVYRWEDGNSIFIVMYLRMGRQRFYCFEAMDELDAWRKAKPAIHNYWEKLTNVRKLQMWESD